MPTCPACQRAVPETATVECPFCGVIFTKWKVITPKPQPIMPTPPVPAASSGVTSRDSAPTTAVLPEEPHNASVSTVLKPCPVCGRDLAGALIMEQLCPYCSATLPDGFDPRPEPPLPPPPLPPTPEELEFASLPFWKKLWKIAWHRRPWVAFLLSLVLLGFNLTMFCVGDHQMLSRLSLPMIVIMAAVAPIVAIGACSPYNLPISLMLIGLCAVTFWRGYKMAWERDPYGALIYITAVYMFVMVGNLLFGIAKWRGYW
jgi:hypothetical protein